MMPQPTVSTQTEKEDSVSEIKKGMLHPPISDLAEKVGSRYQLVNLVARRARSISADAEAKQTSLEKKPVSIAVEEIYTGKLSIRKK